MNTPRNIAAGVQPYEDLGNTKGKSFLTLIIFFVGIINMNIMLLSEVIFVIMAVVNGNNFLEATMTMSYIGFVLVGNCKMLFVWKQKSALTRFVTGLKRIFPEDLEQQELYQLRKYLKQCSRITMSFSLLYMILIWTYNLFSIVQYAIYDRWLNIHQLEQTLPYLMYIPWDWHNHWSYYVLYAAQDLAGYTSAAGQIASDLFLVACATQLIMHFDYLSSTIAHYQSKVGKRGLSITQAQESDMNFLRKMTKYHAYLLDLSEQINNVFGLPLLLNFITSSFVICFVGFQITIGASPETVAKLILFLFSSAAQVYLICHYGQLLIDVSTNVAHAVYNQNWIPADVRYQKMLILIAERAQKPVQLKATTFVHVSRGTMSEIMQISYKFFAVLRTMTTANARTMKLATFDDFMKLANFFYTTVGIQPYNKEDASKDNYNKLMATVIFYTGVINMNYVLFSEILYVIMALVKGENFVEATMTMSYIGFVLVGSFKMFFVYKSKNDLTKFVNGLQQIFPNTPELQAEYNMPYYLKQCSRITLSFSGLYMILIWTYNLFSVIQYLIYELWLNIREVGQTLPYYMYIPWDWNNHWSYYLLYASQDFAGYTSAAGQISGDLMLTAFATQLIMHYDYTSYKIASYEVKRSLKGINEDKGYAQDMEFLRKMIQYHTNLLDLSDQLNNVFGKPLLLNFATSSFVICFVGFQVTVGATPDTILKLLLFLFSSIAQVYLICHYGQNLIDSSTNIAQAVYNQNWIAADIRYQKMLILIAERAQKPAILKATSFVLVSRGTMTEVRSSNFFYTTTGMVFVKTEKLTLAKTLLASFIFYASVINMNYVLSLEVVYVILAIVNKTNFLEATMTLSYIGFVVVGNFKMLFVWRKKAELTKLLNNLKYIFPEKPPQQKQYNLHYYLSQCTRITIAFSLIYMIAIWTYNLFTVTQFLIYEKWLKIRQIEKILPYLMYTPWDWSDHWSYYVLYVSQDFAGYTSAAGQISGDLLLSSCVTQMIMHYDFLTKAIEEYKPKLLDKGVTKATGFRQDMEFLINMIQYHSYLLDLSYQMNNIFGLPILLNFIASSFVICFLGFQMTTGATPETLLKLSLFLAISIAQIYLICYYGQELIDSSVKVAKAVYNQNWPTADVRYQKMLVLITARAQKPAQLKATDMVLISRETMTQLIQISYKFFTLLRTMYVKK
ncbi:uncharacterized protein LOC111687982 [Lucilia cuprina]|uniref:uncharacterized protein LOC111687982 n=1 Tax=Lucilia cuprina TaxID=7375 RepID=UPI001F064213|nr:uncharacterized protein LOC111687982 [Lucilia cuprina]